MAVQTEKTLTFKIEMPINGTLEAVTNALKLREMQKSHPLIEKMDILEETPHFVRATITDRLMMAGFSFRLVYEASSELTQTAHQSAFHNRAKAPMPFSNGALDTHTHILLVPQGQGCVLVDESELFFPQKASWLPNVIWEWLKRYTLRNAEGSHRRMFENVAKSVSVSA